MNTALDIVIALALAAFVVLMIARGRRIVVACPTCRGFGRYPGRCKRCGGTGSIRL